MEVWRRDVPHLSAMPVTAHRFLSMGSERVINISAFQWPWELYSRSASDPLNDGLCRLSEAIASQLTAMLPIVRLFGWWLAIRVDSDGKSAAEQDRVSSL